MQNIQVMKVSVVVPIRNEEPYIRVCLTSLLHQTYPVEQYEIIVLDGRSSDRSREIVEELSSQYTNLRCLDNPAGIVPTAMNIGIRNAMGDIIVRADGHTRYPPDYLEKCVEYLQRTGAENVGGPVLTVPANSSFAARLIAAILCSPFGVGDSRFRTTSAEGYVDTVPFGAYRKQLFARVGFYNEKLVRNQDIDLNARIRQAGGTIYQTPALTTQYHPAARFGEFLKQTFRESRWHVFTMRENAQSLRARHLAPALFISVLIMLMALSFTSKLAVIALSCVLAVYFVAALCAVPTSWNYGPLIDCMLPFGCFCFHLVYGVGTIVGFQYLFSSPPTSPIRAGQKVQ